MKTSLIERQRIQIKTLEAELDAARRAARAWKRSAKLWRHWAMSEPNEYGPAPARNFKRVKRLFLKVVRDE